MKIWKKNIFNKFSAKPLAVVLLGLTLAFVVTYGLYAVGNNSHDKPELLADSSEVVSQNSHEDNSDVLDEKPDFAEQDLSGEVFQKSLQPTARPNSTPSLPADLDTQVQQPNQDSQSNSQSNNPPKQTATPNPESTSNQPTPTPEFTPQTTPASQKVTASITINSGEQFSLELDSDNNHCDVLSEALNKGKISSLKMEYNSALGSFGVYEINGLGQNGQVWWVYEVNGKSPPFGCSQVKVKDGDQIKWNYIGPK